MFKVPENILEFFFIELKKKGKYNIAFMGNSAIIEPRKEQQYYKPNIIVKDLKELEIALNNYVAALNKFYLKNNNLETYHDLSFFFNNLLINMTSSDSEDLTTYIYKRITFFENEQFAEFNEPQILVENDGVKYGVHRVLECPGLETPYVLSFFMEYDGVYYNLPLVRYAFDENNVCHLFAVQFGRDRIIEFDDSYKNIVNRVNTGVTKYRNVSPSFVLSFSLFLSLLEQLNVEEIVVPDFLFGRYRKYIGATGEKRSNQILERILNNFIRLLQRMEFQNENFIIEWYPNEIDSYTHIKLNSNNKKRVLEPEAK
ncbi:MAG: hypothetical protein E7167_03475 [Firmicutes bacterium]|nr:hypothetical protein [Bacillota bacterium]